QAGPQHEALHIAVASDHGHATITGHRDVRAALDGFDDCTLLPGGSGGFMVPGGDAGRIAALAEFLTRQDWCGAVYAADGAIDRAVGGAVGGARLPPGVLPRSALLADHARAAHVLFTLRTDPGPSALGLPGTTLYDGGLPLGGGTHGGLSAAELHTVLMLGGGMIRRGGVSEWPAGLTDIAPTVLALLGLDGGAAMDGRVLREAFAEGADPTDSPAAENWDARGAGGYTQRLARTRLGRHVYLDRGVRE
ncbi:MAG TPA: hypothetical protein VGC16_00455, partial [Rhizomicrobium sp.]